MHIQRYGILLENINFSQTLPSREADAHSMREKNRMHDQITVEISELKADNRNNESQEGSCGIQKIM